MAAGFVRARKGSAWFGSREEQMTESQRTLSDPASVSDMALSLDSRRRRPDSLPVASIPLNLFHPLVLIAGPSSRPTELAVCGLSCTNVAVRLTPSDELVGSSPLGRGKLDAPAWTAGGSIGVAREAKRDCLNVYASSTVAEPGVLERESEGGRGGKGRSFLGGEAEDEEDNDGVAGTGTDALRGKKCRGMVVVVGTSGEVLIGSRGSRASPPSVKASESGASRGEGLRKRATMASFWPNKRTERSGVVSRSRPLGWMVRGAGSS